MSAAPPKAAPGGADRPSAALAGRWLLGIFVAIALVGPLFVGDPSAPSGPPLAPPSLDHLFGTTAQGQDVLAQVIVGARTTLFVGFFAGILAVAIGAAIGGLAGYAGGWVDTVLSLLTQVALVIPGLPLAVLLAAWLPPGASSLIAVLVLTGWAWNARVLRAAVLDLRGRDWVTAARLSGEGPLRIVFVELLPNLRPLLAAALVGATVYAIGAQVGLEFLGLGDPGAVTWGTNLYWASNDGALLTGAWWTFVPTGAAIAGVGLALALLNAGADDGAGAPQDTEVDRTRFWKDDEEERPTPLLEVRDLTVEYRGAGAPLRAVDGVSFTLSRGEVLGLAGESGSGKSTLALALLRMLRAPAVVTGGRVHLQGRDLLSLDAPALAAVRWRDVAVVLQSALDALDPVRTVGAQLRDTLLARRSGPAHPGREQSLVALVGLPAEALERFPHQLSGGQRQRVCIAIALALSPSLLVLDEPTTALDVVVQREILQRLLSLQKEQGFAMILVSHDLPLLFDVADRIGVLYAGKLVEIGPTAEVRAAPAHPYTRGLIRAAPSVSGPRRPLLGIPGVPPDLRAPPPGCRFAERCSLAVARCSTVEPALHTVERGWEAACHGAPGLHAEPEVRTRPTLRDSPALLAGPALSAGTWGDA